MRWMRWLLRLLCCVTLLGTAGCQSMPVQTPSSALPRIAELLTLKPFETDCRTAFGRIVPCVLVRKEDYERIVIELKTACLREGGTPAQCDTEGE